MESFVIVFPLREFMNFIKDYFEYYCIMVRTI